MSTYTLPLDSWVEIKTEVEKLKGALAVEHETQRLMLERLGITWTPGEPFYSLVEYEIVQLRSLSRP
jgi:hypothetical protein